MENNFFEIFFIPSGSVGNSVVMTRVLFAPNDLLTLFDLRAKNVRVNVEFFT